MAKVRVKSFDGMASDLLSSRMPTVKRSKKRGDVPGILVSGDTGETLNSFARMNVIHGALSNFLEKDKDRVKSHGLKVFLDDLWENRTRMTNPVFYTTNEFGDIESQCCYVFSNSFTVTYPRGSKDPQQDLIDALVTADVSESTATRVVGELVSVEYDMKLDLSHPKALDFFRYIQGEVDSLSISVEDRAELLNSVMENSAVKMRVTDESSFLDSLVQMVESRKELENVLRVIKPKPSVTSVKAGESLTPASRLRMLTSVMRSWLGIKGSDEKSLNKSSE